MRWQNTWTHNVQSVETEQLIVKEMKTPLNCQTHFIEYLKESKHLCKGTPRTDNKSTTFIVSMKISCVRWLNVLRGANVSKNCVRDVIAWLAILLIPFFFFLSPVLYAPILTGDGKCKERKENYQIDPEVPGQFVYSERLTEFDNWIW